MEVHHHPHVPTHVKPWKEYLLEGIMIFIAVSFGYTAENIREHYIETKKAVSSARNLYVDLVADSVEYASSLEKRQWQEKYFDILNKSYQNNQIKKDIPTVYAAHQLLAQRLMPIMNNMALDEVKNSGALKFIDDKKLKVAIQAYSSMAANIKVREQREFGYIDRLVDPLTVGYFQFDFYRKFSYKTKIVNKKIIIDIPIPPNLKIMNEAKLDWNQYMATLGMLQMIRESTNEVTIIPTQKKCNELLVLLRAYLIEHNAFNE